MLRPPAAPLMVPPHPSLHRTPPGLMGLLLSPWGIASPWVGPENHVLGPRSAPPPPTGDPQGRPENCADFTASAGREPAHEAVSTVLRHKPPGKTSSVLTISLPSDQT